MPSPAVKQLIKAKGWRKKQIYTNFPLTSSVVNQPRHDLCPNFASFFLFFWVLRRHCEATVMKPAYQKHCRLPSDWILFKCASMSRKNSQLKVKRWVGIPNNLDDFIHTLPRSTVTISDALSRRTRLKMLFLFCFYCFFVVFSHADKSEKK